MFATTGALSSASSSSVARMRSTSSPTEKLTTTLIYPSISVSRSLSCSRHHIPHIAGPCRSEGFAILKILGIWVVMVKLSFPPGLYVQHSFGCCWKICCCPSRTPYLRHSWRGFCYIWLKCLFGLEPELIILWLSKWMVSVASQLKNSFAPPDKCSTFIETSWVDHVEDADTTFSIRSKLNFTATL